MKNIFKFLIALILISTFSCTDSEVLYQPIDFLFVGKYTQGLEGPAVDVNGNIYFVNPTHSGSIGIIDGEGKFDLFIEYLPKGSTANGIRFGDDQEMFLADYTGHNVLSR